MTTNDIDAIRKLTDAATPGPWEVGYRWLVAGVVDHMYGTGKCAYCKHFGEPVWVGKDDINGTLMLAHHHRDNSAEVNPHEITADVQRRIAGNYDYEAGGIIAPADSEFIAAARTHVPALCDEVEQLRAERDQLAAYNRSVKGANDDLRAELADLRTQTHRDTTNHQQIVRANTELANERDRLKGENTRLRAKLADLGKPADADHWAQLDGTCWSDCPACEAEKARAAL